jgi:uncharacterized membrane protein
MSRYRLPERYLVDMDDVVLVTKDDEGKVKLHQARNFTGAISGASGER